MMSLLATVLILLNSSAIGQTLDLPRAAGPPSLVQPTYAADLIKELEGEIALGAPFEDFTVPTVSFKFADGKMHLQKK